MSTNTAGAQAQTQTATVQTVVTTPAPKGEKKTDQILALLAKLEPGKLMTIGEIQVSLGSTDDKGKNVIQSTLSQMKSKGKVHKDKTGNRMPGYCLPANAKTAPTSV